MMPKRSTKSLIDELVRTTGAATPKDAVIHKAKQLVSLCSSTFPDTKVPINVDVLASMQGIGRSDERPMHSEDAELVPGHDGQVKMRVNPDRPESRQRFSIAHEISHTFFPHYTQKIWCRPDGRNRDSSNPDDLLEILCDVGAAELLMPAPWFASDAAAVGSAMDLVNLGRSYGVSRDAIIRRYAEVSDDHLAAVFFSWKLKPTQKADRNPKQRGLFDGNPGVRDGVKLRIDYRIGSSRFLEAGPYLAEDKSIQNDGPIYDAARTGEPAQGDAYLDLGAGAGFYQIWAIPLWTTPEQVGPNGENAVAAVIRPLN